MAERRPMCPAGRGTSACLGSARMWPTVMNWEQGAIMSVTERLEELGLALPGEMRLPPGVKIPFQWVRVSGNRALISGHGALAADGSAAGPFGKVPSEVPLEEAQESARLATLAMLASLQR